MRKVSVFICLLLAVFFLAVLTGAQQANKVHRIGFLSSFDPASEFARSEAIRLRLRELGYIEGQNIVTEYRYSKGRSIHFLSLRPSSCASRSMSSWQREVSR